MSKAAKCSNLVTTLALGTFSRAAAARGESPNQQPRFGKDAQCAALANLLCPRNVTSQQDLPGS